MPRATVVEQGNYQVDVGRVLKAFNVVLSCVWGMLSEVIRGVLNRPGELLARPAASNVVVGVVELRSAACLRQPSRVGGK